MIQQSLASIPTSKDAPLWTVKDWCEDRKDRIFLTSTPDTAETIRPLQSLWMLIRRLMAQREHPDLRAPWFFFDELAKLQRLPMLERAMNQGRKFNLRMVLGFQAMSEVEYLYRRDQGSPRSSDLYANNREHVGRAATGILEEETGSARPN